MAPQKKKTIAFKSTHAISNDEEEEEEEEDEELSLLIRNVIRAYNKKKYNHRRRRQGKEEKKIICFNYRKPEHIMAEGPDFRNKISSSIKQKKPFMKKALKDTWDISWLIGH